MQVWRTAPAGPIEEVGRMKSINLPTWFTLSRFGAALFIPVVFLLFERPVADYFALAVFSVGAITDFVDGQLARRLRLESKFGEALDPIADKALVLVALAVLLAYFDLQEWLLLPVAVIFVRELLIAGLREYLGKAGGTLKVTWTAKWKAACQMFAIILLFFSGAVVHFSEVSAAIGVIVLWIAAGLTFVSGFDYVHKAIRKMEGESEGD